MMEMISESLEVDFAYVEAFAFEDANPIRLWGAFGRSVQLVSHELVRETRRNRRTLVVDGRRRLCTPIPGRDRQAYLYLERAIAFPSEDIERAERFARQLAIVISRIAPRTEALPLVEQMRLFKQQRVYEALYRNDWRVASAARELRVARSMVYRIVGTVRRRRRS
ncbi:MAG: hypothetical protein KF773_27290 [Deltaproteobacteria bacterium]|nr:hypothetical protein [Deltaproteobacteria bacterium]